MYNEFFKLENSPFSIAPDPRYLYMSERHREALAHLLYGMKSNGGFVLLTGEVGTGKTTVCRCLLEQIPENTQVALIFNPKLNAEELLATICDELEIPYPKENHSIKVFVDLINDYLLKAHARGDNTVLIIDEAQNLSSEVLEQLRLLTNLETNEQKLLQIILLGQPELHDKLAQPELRQLAQRITARYYLGPLSQEEVSDYVRHRLRVAGSHEPLFQNSSMKKLFQLSGGVPRLINVICDRAMLGAYAQDQKTIDKRTLTKAAKEVFGEGTYAGSSRKASRLAWTIAILLLAGGISVAASHYYDAGQQSAGLPSAPLPETAKVNGTLQIPDHVSSSRSRQIAFQKLFQLWGIDYDPGKDGDPCLFAQDSGLRCLHKQGNLGGLRLMNRPAILKLYTHQSEAWYVPLTGLRERSAQLILNGKTRGVDLNDLERYWRGETILLWRPPPDYRGDMLPGMQGAGVQWLSKKLSSILAGTLPEPAKDVYDHQLVEQVKDFQRSQGLEADGIAGPQTVIRINTLSGENVPLLLHEQAEG